MLQRRVREEQAAACEVQVKTAPIRMLWLSTGAGLPQGPASESEWALRHVANMQSITEAVWQDGWCFETLLGAASQQ